MNTLVFCEQKLGYKLPTFFLCGRLCTLWRKQLQFQFWIPGGNNERAHVAVLGYATDPWICSRIRSDEPSVNSLEMQKVTWPPGRASAHELQTLEVANTVRARATPRASQKAVGVVPWLQARRLVEQRLDMRKTCKHDDRVWCACFTVPTCTYRTKQLVRTWFTTWFSMLTFQNNKKLPRLDTVLRPLPRQRLGWRLGRQELGEGTLGWRWLLGPRRCLEPATWIREMGRENEKNMGLKQECLGLSFGEATKTVGIFVWNFELFPFWTNVNGFWLCLLF